jgi:hypothetical protein
VEKPDDELIGEEIVADRAKEVIFLKASMKKVLMKRSFSYI